MKYMHGDLKITELSVKIQEKIERKEVKDYFKELLENYYKNISLWFSIEEKRGQKVNFNIDIYIFL